MNKKKYENQLYDVKYVETIKEMIDASVEAFPDRVAYMYKDEHKEPFKTMTYAEFKAEQNAIGALLSTLARVQRLAKYEQEEI